jgi:hypothetical protein
MFCCRRKRSPLVPSVRFAVGSADLWTAVWNNVEAVRCDCRSLQRRGWGQHDGRALESIVYVVNDENFGYALRWMKQCILDAYEHNRDRNFIFVEAFCRSGLHRSVAMVTITAVLLQADGVSAVWDSGSTDFWRTWKSPCSCQECTFVWTPALLEQRLGPENWLRVRDAWGERLSFM